MIKTLTTLALTILATSSCTREPQKPNILMIAIDDMNDWIGVMGGNPQTLTPHIDFFANEAMVFQNASCPGPVCGPSRSALLSGFMPATSGIYGNSNNMLDSKLVQEHATLPEYFSKNGYLTISKGKIFHKHTTVNGWDHGHWAFDVWEKATGSGSIREDQMYSRNKGIIAGKKIPDAKYTTEGVEFGWAPTEAGKEETKDYRTATWFAGKLKENYEKPFFMSVGISKPHLPWYVPQEYFDLYGLDTLKIPEYRLDDLDDIVDEAGRKAFYPAEDFLWLHEDEELFKRAVRAYMAASTYADECVGVVLDALKESKYAENTIVIIFGDHGWHLGEKLKFRKATLWNESTQLPLIIHLPGMTGQQYCSRNVNLIDLYPTLIDLCSLPEKPEIDGRSIAPLLVNPKQDWYPAVTTRGPGAHSVISEEWHYINHGNGVVELYDLEKDPMEWTNLASSESGKINEVKAYMQSLLPENSADPIPGSNKNKSLKTVDPTIKERRDLQILK